MDSATTEWGEFSFPDGDHIGRSMKAGVHYEKVLIRRIVEICDPEGTAVDVGANIGTHTIPYGKTFKSVIAFEPHPIAHRILGLNISLNYLVNVTTFNFALGEEAGTGHMKIDEQISDNLGGARIHERGNVEFPIHRLDDYQIPNVSLIKIDVEGYEGRVVFGARKTIEACRPVVVFEQLEPDRFFNIFGFLMCDLSYTSVERISKNFIAIP